jgi:hypothetical protein
LHYRLATTKTQLVVVFRNVSTYFNFQSHYHKCWF